jgi:hypothetical protein
VCVCVWGGGGGEGGGGGSGGGTHCRLTGAVTAPPTPRLAPHAACCATLCCDTLAHAHAPAPQGTYFLVADVSSLLRRGEDDVALCKRLTVEAGVTLIPISAFYASEARPHNLVRSGTSRMQRSACCGSRARVCGCVCVCVCVCVRMCYCTCRRRAIVSAHGMHHATQRRCMPPRRARPVLLRWLLMCAPQVLLLQGRREAGGGV